MTTGIKDRYSRQILFSGIGEAGQQKLGASSVAIIGCGALGTVIATALVRAGVGKIRIIDRDLIEYHNLQRQILFNEEDVKNGLPKAVAAENHLKKVNSSIEIEGIVADVHYGNIEKYVSDADLILDALDNQETRFLINDVSLKYNIPWIYGGAVSASGMTMTIIPGETPCFRCISPSVAPRGIIPNCDTAGVISPAPIIVGALQSAQALKLLVGDKEINRDIIIINAWQETFHHIKVQRRKDCPACQGKYEFLQRKLGVRTTILCGQNSVQVIDPNVEVMSLPELASHLQPLVNDIKIDKFTLRFTANNHELVVFPDGRFMVKDSFDEPLARSLYTRYVGTFQ
ncbi:ThiF family adenylyltransferase [Chloroflexota bacterium]